MTPPGAEPLAPAGPVADATRLGQVPLRPDEMSAAFLTEALRASGALAAAAVTAVTSVVVGTGQMGTSVRYDLAYDLAEPSAPGSVVAKFASDSADVRAFMSQVGYLREIEFYRGPARRCAARVPACHVAHLESDGSFLLLLEDLRPLRSGDQLRGLTAQEATAAVRELVRLHASFWGDESLLEIPIFVRRDDDPDGVGAMLTGAVPGFLDRVGDALTAEQRRFYERLAAGAPTWLRHRPAATTLAHNDYRPDNLMFAADGSQVAVLDWQGASWGSGGDDLAFLLGTSLEPDVRRACERDLVGAYTDGLLAAGVRGIDRASCWEDYRRAPISGLFTTILGAAFGAPTERGDRMFKAMARRTAQQVLDLGADEHLTA